MSAAIPAPPVAQDDATKRALLAWALTHKREVEVTYIELYVLKTGRGVPEHFAGYRERPPYVGITNLCSWPWDDLKWLVRVDVAKPEEPSSPAARLAELDDPEPTR
jgi:hypothetical protein